jgi:glycine/D-amino acid oxidase-like deaminating enzyme
VKLAADGPERSLDLVGGRPLWPGLHPSFPSYPPISADTTCDAAVIGAGVTGALIASVLGESGFDVVVIERHEVARGSTAASTALLLYETDLPLHRLADRIGEPNAAQVYQLCRDAVVGFAGVVSGLDDTCGFARRPSLYLASREEDVPALRREYEVRRRYGFAVEFLERADIESRYAFSSPAALLSRDAAEVDPVCFTHQLLAHAARRGARVHERTAITELRSNDERIELTTESGCRLVARRAILATGYESERYLGRLARSNSTYALATEQLDALPDWPDRALIWETARPYVYLRTTQDNRVLIGGLDEPDVGRTERDALLEQKCRGLLTRLRSLFPSLEARVARAWCGTLLNTGDSLPYIGQHPEAPRLHLALCYGGNGTTFGLVAAELLRDTMLGRARPEAALFRLGR